MSEARSGETPGRAGASGRELIEGLRAADGSLDRAALRRLLPYGDDFLFVDAVASIGPEAVEASYVIPEEAPFIRAHFRDLPVMPGALIAEGWAQAGTLIVRWHLESPDDKLVVGLQIERARFARPAFPGDTLEYSARLTTRDRRAARLEGEVRVAGRRIARLAVVVGITPAAALRQLGARGGAGGRRNLAERGP